MLVDNSYLLNYNALKHLQQILNLAHFLHLCPDQCLFFELHNNLIVSGDNNSNL